MKMPIVKTKAFQCTRCNHVWISNRYKDGELPVSCSNCKSSYWNHPRVRTLEKVQEKRRGKNKK